jgi:uncharacterized membrane protein
MAKGTVERYLHELDRELQDLPQNRRRELLDEIREHIGAALEEAPSREEAEVRNVLDRLGDPTEIADEARQRFGIRRTEPGIRETLALVLLPIGGVIVPVLGWIVGAILLIGSRVWTSQEKVIGMLLFPGGLLPAVALTLFPAQVCSSAELNGVVTESCSGGIGPVLAWAILAVLVVVPIWTTYFLASRMRRRAPA